MKRTQDASGSIVTTFTGAVTVALGTTTSGAVLSGTATVNAVAGVATFSTLSINKSFTGYTLVATAGSFLITSTPFNITPGSTSALVIQHAAREVRWRSVSLAPVVVTARRRCERKCHAGVHRHVVTMALGTTTSGAVLGGTVTVSAVAGVATFSTLSINKAFAGYTLVASSGALTPATSTAFNISAGPAATITSAGGTGQSGFTGAALATPIAVKISDAARNGVAGDDWWPLADDERLGRADERRERREWPRRRGSSGRSGRPSA